MLSKINRQISGIRMFLAKVPNTTVLRFFLLEKEIAPIFVPTTTMLSGVLTETSDLIGVKTS